MERSGWVKASGSALARRLKSALVSDLEGRVEPGPMALMTEGVLGQQPQFRWTPRCWQRPLKYCLHQSFVPSVQYMQQGALLILRRLWFSSSRWREDTSNSDTVAARRWACEVRCINRGSGSRAENFRRREMSARIGDGVDWLRPLDSERSRFNVTAARRSARGGVLSWWGGGDRTAEEYGGSGTYRRDRCLR